MKLTQKATLAVLVVLLGAAAIGLDLTSGPTVSPPSGNPSAVSPAETPAINQLYLDQARRLADQASTPDEQRSARAALSAADHELDLEYAYALELASVEPVPQTPEIQAIQDRIANIKTAIQKRQAEINQIKAALRRVEGARRAALQDQLDVSQAELNLFQEGLADSKDDLIQAGGDPEQRLAELKAEHQAASNAADTFRFPPLASAAPASSLLARWSSWRSIHARQMRIWQARQQVLAATAALTRLEDAIEKQIAAEQAQRKALAAHELTPEQIAGLMARERRQPAAPRQPAKPSASPSSEAQSEAGARDAAIALIHRISSSQILEHILDRRVQVMNGLASAYAAWAGIIASRGRSALHAVIAGGLWIVLLMAFAFLLNRLIERFFARLSLERKQRTTLQAVLRISVRLVIVIVILMMIFGKPNQLSTVLGLAGAGLAVALQDFILSFLGWFVLMGRHGIRVGDWVEINSNAFAGVRGEVIEITLFRTVLLETGNWTEAGHWTGRKVAFMNMYAVNGYFFNFSTAGQWLWDELQVAIPSGQNPYPLIEKIRAIVARETEAHAQLAEQEWQRVSRRYGTRPLSARPAVNVKPAENALIAVVRYITRAEERTATRYRLNREIVKLLHHGEELVPGAEVLTPVAAPPSEPET